jgi:hypothetical protein
MSCKNESLVDFATRTSHETGFDDKPQSPEWIRIKSHIIEEATRIFCNYHNGGSELNSCCQHEYQCRTAVTAAARIRFGDKPTLV